MPHKAKKLPKLAFWNVDKVYDRVKEFKQHDDILDPIETRALLIAKGHVKVELAEMAKKGKIPISRKKQREIEIEKAKSPGKGKGKGKGKSSAKKSASSKNAKMKELEESEDK